VTMSWWLALASRINDTTPGYSYEYLCINFFVGSRIRELRKKCHHFFLNNVQPKHLLGNQIKHAIETAHTHTNTEKYSIYLIGKLLFNSQKIQNSNFGFLLKKRERKKRKRERRESTPCVPQRVSLMSD
jgi:hypothetical protein